MQGTLHRKVLEEHQIELGPGCGLLLKQVRTNIVIYIVCCVGSVEIQIGISGGSCSADIYVEFWTVLYSKMYRTKIRQFSITYCIYQGPAFFSSFFHSLRTSYG